jgi:hypothetical protein
MDDNANQSSDEDQNTANFNGVGDEFGARNGAKKKSKAQIAREEQHLHNLTHSRFVRSLVKCSLQLEEEYVKGVLKPLLTNMYRFVLNSYTAAGKEGKAGPCDKAGKPMHIIDVIKKFC